MKERPIIFSGEMVRAILDGRKSQTRRVIKPQPNKILQGDWSELCPYGKISDRLWVKQGYHKDDYNTPSGYRYISPIFMPKSMARIWLEITNIRVEKLQDISREDALAEGIEGGCGPNYDFALHAYKMLWDKLNAKRGYSWDKNPWVWVIEFKKVL